MRTAMLSAQRLSKNVYDQVSMNVDEHKVAAHDAILISSLAYASSAVFADELFDAISQG
jgi:hypothetical protein